MIDPRVKMLYNIYLTDWTYWGNDISVTDLWNRKYKICYYNIIIEHKEKTGAECRLILAEKILQDILND